MAADACSKTDFVIIGGGIAGLWLLNILSRCGFAVVLVENRAFGHGQTIAAQGLIHGGIKYALSGALNAASEAIAEMPSAWRRALHGNPDHDTALADLSQVTCTSQDFHLWSDANLFGQLTAFLASKSIRGRVQPLAAEAFPEAFAGLRGRGRMYRLRDFVVDVSSVLHALAEPWRQRCLLAELQDVTTTASGHRLTLRHANEQCRVETHHVILCAGAGNAALLGQFGLAKPTMQRRPLHQVWVRSAHLPAVNGHCLTGIRSAEPRLTITSHPQPSAMVWSIGGALATRGVERSAAAQTAFALQELRQCLPWINFDGTQLMAQRIDRAEPQTTALGRPDQAFMSSQRNVLTCWPTKLTLTPDLSRRMLEHIASAAIAPRADPALPSDNWPRPAAADPPWHNGRWN